MPQSPVVLLVVPASEQATSPEPSAVQVCWRVATAERTRAVVPALRALLFSTPAEEQPA